MKLLKQMSLKKSLHAQSPQRMPLQPMSLQLIASFLLLCLLAPIDLVEAQDLIQINKKDTVRLVEMPDGDSTRHWLWFHDDRTGSVFAFNQLEAKIFEFNPAMGHSKAPIDLPSIPKSINFSSGGLIVSCRDAIVFVDKTTRERKGNIEISWHDHFGVSSSPSSPIAYALVSDEDHAPWLWEMDIRTAKVTRKKQLDSLADGFRYEFSRELQRPKPSTHFFAAGDRFVAMEIDEKTLEAKRAFSIPLYRYSRYRVPAYSRFYRAEQSVLIIGSMIWHSGRWKPIKGAEAGEEENPVEMAVHPLLDMAAISYLRYIDDEYFRQVDFVRLSDNDRIATLKLTADEDTPDTTDNLSMIRFQQRESLLLLGFQSGLLTVDISKLEKKFHPLIELDTPFDNQIVAGQKLERPLKLTNPSLNAKASHRLVEGPQGMVIEDGVIRWSPSTTEIGIHPVAIETTCENRSKTTRFPFSVIPKRIELAFDINGFNLSPSLKYAVAWNDPSRGRSSGFDDFEHGESRGLRNKIAVIDLSTHEVVMTREMQTRVHRAWVDGQYVYYSSSNQSSFFQVPIGDADNVKLVKTPSIVDEVLEFGDDEIIVCCTEADEQVAINRKTFQLNRDSRKTYNLINSRSYRIERKPSPTQQGLIHSGCRLVDPENGYRTHCLVGRVMIGSIDSSWRREEDDFRVSGWSGSSDVRFAWGLKILDDITFPRWGGVGHSDVAISTKYPIGASVGRVDRTEIEESEKIEPTADVAITFFDLPRGSTKKRIFVSDVKIKEDLAEAYWRSKLAGDQLIIWAGSVSYVLPIPEEARKTAPPFHLLFPEMHPVEVTKKESFEIKASGYNSSKLTYHLKDESPGVSIDSQTGILTFDGPEYFRSIVESYQKGLKSKKRSDRESIKERIVPEVDPDEYYRTTGFELPEGYSVGMRGLAITAINEDAGETSLHVNLVVLIPKFVVENVKRQVDAKMLDVESLLDPKAAASALAENTNSVDSNVNKPMPAGALTSAFDLKWGLAFSGNDYVQTDYQTLFKQPFMIQLIATPWLDQSNQSAVSMLFSNYADNRGLRLYIEDEMVQLQLGTGVNSKQIKSDDKIVNGETMYVAAVWDGKQLSLYLNGKRQTNVVEVSEPKNSDHKFVIGAAPEIQSGGDGDRSFFAGVVHGIQINRPVKKLKEIISVPNRLISDEHTLCLWELKKGEGNKIFDSSDAGNHGTIFGATWLASDLSNLSRSQDTRSTWLSASTAKIAQVDDNSWIETTKTSSKVRFRFTETKRNMSYIEIYDSRRRLFIRLYDDRASILYNNQTVWRRLFAGGWEEKPRSSEK